MGIVALLSALAIIGTTLGCRSGEPVVVAPAEDTHPCCPAPPGGWVFESTIREQQTQYVVTRMLMERIARDTGDEVLAAVKMWALYYEVDEAYALCIAHRESSLNQTAVGDDGNAIGLWQFWLPTWEMFRKKMQATPDDLRGDLHESTRTAMWAFANGYARHWAPVKKGLCEASDSG
jgi:hypothetical protein